MQAWLAEYNYLKNIKNLTFQKRLTGSVLAYLFATWFLN